MGKKEKKAVKNFKIMLEKNQPYIDRIVLSEELIDTLYRNPELVEIDQIKETINEEGDETEVWYLFGIPAVMSIYVLRGCILEMRNGEFVVIKGI